MTILNGKIQYWQAEEDARLLLVCRSEPIRGDLAWRKVAEQFPGRTPSALQQRWVTLRNREKQQASGEPVRSQRSRLTAAKEYTMQQPVQPSALPQPASLTAAVFGDPLPGRSALDRRGAAQ